MYVLGGLGAMALGVMGCVCGRRVRSVKVIVYALGGLLYTFVCMPVQYE